MVEQSTLVFNADVHTMGPTADRAHWFYVENGHIRDMGMFRGYTKYMDIAETVVDAKGRTVLPGFIDSHVFLLQTGINAQGINLADATTLEEVYDLISDRARRLPPGQFIRASNFDEFKLRERCFPTRNNLDRVCPRHPVWINRKDMHTSILNTSALGRMNIPFNLPGYGMEGGVPTGVIKDHANAAVRKHIYNTLSVEEKEAALRIGAEMALEKGITTLVAVDGGFLFGDTDYQFINDRVDGLPIDVVQFANTTNVREPYKDRVKHCGSYFLDGTFTSRTAALFEHYRDDPDNYGSLYFSEESLYSLFENTHLLDMQIAVHSIGDRAIDMALRAFGHVLAKYPKKDHRHRIEYFALADESMIRRVRDLGLYVMMIPSFMNYWCHGGSMYEEHIGKERMDRCYPLRLIQEAGIPILGGSDSDVTEMNPILGLAAAVNTPNPNSKLSLRQALKMFTINGAKGVFQENIKGSLEKHKQADFIILDCEIDTVGPEQLSRIGIEKTFRKGVLVYES